MKETLITMKRVPEPELMNDAQQAEAYALADFSTPHNLFVEKFGEKFPSLNFNDVILDLGCGSCDITRRMARVFPDAGFHALDGATAMLNFARKMNEEAGLAERIRLIEGCLPGAQLPQQSYHLLISNSLLHHLRNPFVLWQAIQEHAKPYANVFVMDLIRPADEHTVAFMVNEYASAEAEILQRDFANSLRAAFTIAEIQQQLDEMGFNKLHIEQVSDRHMIVWGSL